MPALQERRLLTGRLRTVTPFCLGAYLESGGGEGLRKALALTSEQVVAEVRASRLTGRGGAGFPAALKWAAVAAQPSTPRYLVVNADEGEPGTRKDLTLLLGDPHLLLEGLLIAAYACRAERGFLYINGDYADAIAAWREFTPIAREDGWLGEGILGSDFSFDLRVVAGQGLYIAGEECALLASLEGRRPVSRPKPPYPAESGLFGQPTCVNNVETLCNVPFILACGAEWYRGIGSGDETGTRLLTLSGDVARPGVYEIETGRATFRQVIDNLGGGTASGLPVKAFQPGGGSTAFLTAEHLDIPVADRALREAGSSLGTGAVIVYDESRNMVAETARLMDFFARESCGRCAPCRIGAGVVRDILHRMQRGRSTAGDIDTIQDVCAACGTASTCGLGRSFPNPVLSSMERFGGEYLKPQMDTD
jgi:NADH-quinone oxidoreductase subunit F